MSPLTVEALSKKLKYSRISEERAPIKNSDGNVTGYSRYLFVHPKTPRLPKIYFEFHDAGLAAFGFAHWHHQFYECMTDEDEIRAATKHARQFMRHQLCLVEELDSQGRGRGIGAYWPTEVPSSLHRSISKLRRIFFDRSPVIEAVDLSRYSRSGDFYVEKITSRRTKRFTNEFLERTKK